MYEFTLQYIFGIKSEINLPLRFHLQRHIRGLFKTYRTLIFSRINKWSTGSVHHCRCGLDIYAHAWIFFPPIESVSRRQSVDDCVSVVNARQIVSYCKMTERLEQRYCIKFCQKLGDTQAETIRKIQQAFGDDAMSITRIKEWYNRFKDGSTSVDSEPCHGRPSTTRNGNVIN